jgi:kumamolisin
MNRFNLWAPSSLMLMGLLHSSSIFAQPINLVVRLKEKVSIQELADNAVKYGVTYTPEEIRDMAGPSVEDYANVITELKQQGFEIVSESKTRLFVTVRAEKQAVEDAFQTKFAESEGVRTPLTPAVIPASLNLIDSVIGLDNSRKLRPRYKILRQDPSVDFSGKPKPTTQGGVLPATIKTTYGFDPIYANGFTGKGQHIAIATYDNLKLSDVTAYYTKIGLKTAPTVDVVSFNGTASYNMDSAMETELDVEFSGMIAPGAAIHVFASADNSSAGELALFTAILDDNRAKVVNYSWGSCEPQTDPAHKTAMDSVFARAVAQGVNITVASGDSGSSGCGDGSLAADYPASNPNVVAIGGTTLVNSGSTFESAWADSGGGISTLYSSPAYQAGLASPYNGMRSLPDVSFNADPKSGEAAWEYADMDGSQSAKAPSWNVLGGTSIAAPQWAGFLTLVNEARVSKNQGTLGFVNPIIYGLSASQRAATFNDVTQGSNGAYKAATGWDAVTGWGSMKASALFTTLTE